MLTLHARARSQGVCDVNDGWRGCDTSSCASGRHPLLTANIPLRTRPYIACLVRRCIMQSLTWHEHDPVSWPSAHMPGAEPKVQLGFRVYSVHKPPFHAGKQRARRPTTAGPPPWPFPSRGDVLLVVKSGAPAEYKVRQKPRPRAGGASNVWCAAFPSVSELVQPRMTWL